MNDPLPARLPARDPRGHKGTFGTVAVVGGCAEAGTRMIGGPALAARGACRGGAGLVRLVMPGPVLDAGIVMCHSATGVALPVDHEHALIAHESAVILDRVMSAVECLAIGPGLGVGEGARAVSLRAAVQESVPVVFDADALNNLADIRELQRDFHAHAVLTPHPGEYARLAETLRLNTDPTDPERRVAAAERLAQVLGVVVVLKGARTVVSDGHRSWTCAEENAALATAGTGDVLTGLLAALIAQHHRRPMLAGERTVTSEQRGGLGLYDCARLAVEAHARAARAWTKAFGATGGLLAEELADGLPAALETLRA